MKISDEVKLTKQHQITIPKRICEALQLHGGERLELTVMPGNRLELKPKKMIDADDQAYLLGKEILEAEAQIREGKTADWSDIKKQHGL